MYLLYNNQRIAKKKTHVKKRTLNPVFNESFVFEIPAGAENMENVSMEFLLLDWDRVTKNEVTSLKSWLNFYFISCRLSAAWNWVRRKTRAVLCTIGMRCARRLAVKSQNGINFGSERFTNTKRRILLLPQFQRPDQCKRRFDNRAIAVGNQADERAGACPQSSIFLPWILAACKSFLPD